MSIFTTENTYRLTRLAARRALTYPYDCAYRPMIVTGGGFLQPRVRAWTAEDDTAALLRGRAPTLAVGSNRAARQLARKYADWREPLAIPVWPVWVNGIDVHFAASIGHYGAIPATPVRAPGTICAMMLVWLTPSEFVRMDETEGLGIAYDRFDVPVEADSGVPGDVSSVVLYRHRAGTIATFGHRSIGMAELPVHDRRQARMSQPAMQRFLCRRLAPGIGLNQFIAGNIADPLLRQRRVDRLPRHAIAPWQPAETDRQGTVSGKTPPITLQTLLL
ncbi:MAG: hypothetical protein CL559_14070 [Alphaproteobacteria bacterium]|nr:hypothetical protein [Alphaproteobacteria bacterium]